MLRLLFLITWTGVLLAQTNPIDRAWKMAANGQRDQAITLLQQFTRSNPRNADARLLLGSLLTEAGQGAEAIIQLKEAAKLRPQSAEAQNALGEAYNGFGDSKAARGPFERAVEINPAFGVAQLNLGQVLLASGELDPAAEHLDRAIKLLPRDEDGASARYLRAKVYTARDEPSKAAEELQQAVSIRPSFPEAWSDLGEARKTLLDDAGAVAAFEHAVQLAPNDAVAQYRLGAAYLDNDKPHDALPHLEQAYRLSPGDQSTLNALQKALRQEGQSQEADEIKRKLADLLQKRDRDNQNAVAATELNNKGAALQKAGDLSGAMEKYRAAVALSPENVAIRVNYGIALLRLGKWTDGLNELHGALLRDPSNIKLQEALKEALAQAPPGTVPSWK